MAKRIQEDRRKEDQVELEEYKIHIEPKRDDPDDITTVESSIVVNSGSGPSGT